MAHGVPAVMTMDDRDSLDRFVNAQKRDFPTALEEIEDGMKVSHWMWYIFPQLRGLGLSFNSDFYGIDGMDEARRYLDDVYLRENLLTITKALLKHVGKDIEDIMGRIDAVKLRSCMTLFHHVSDERVFTDVLEAFYDGREDPETLRLLGIE